MKFFIFLGTILIGLHAIGATTKNSWYFLNQKLNLPGAMSLETKPYVGTEQRLEYMFEFNKQAVQIWSELLTCTRGDINKLRKAYYLVDFPCVNHMEIKSTITDFHVQIRNFLQTESYENIGLLTQSINAKVFHPFLVQTMLEILVTTIRFSGNSAMNDQMLFGGSWLEYPYSLDFGKRVKALTQGFIPSANEREKYSQAQIYLGGLALAKLFVTPRSGGDCMNLGLWPEAGVVLSNAISTQANAIVGGTNHVNELLDFMCISPLNTYELGLDYEPIIKEYRMLAEKYGVGAEAKSNCRYYLNLVKSSGRFVRCISIDPGSSDDPVWINE